MRLRVCVFVSHPGKQRATSSTNRSLTTMSTAGLLLPLASASSSIASGRLEDGPEQYQHQNQTPSVPFSQSQSQSQSLVPPHPQTQLQSQQSQSQPVSETPSLSDCSLFLPQDTAQRMLGTTSTTTGGGIENGNLRWDGESGGSGMATQHSQSQGPSRQQKMTRQEALAQILEYHQAGLARSMGAENGTDGGSRDECRGHDGDGVGDERGKREMRDSHAELDRHGTGKVYTSSSTTQQQQTCRQPPASLSSSASAGPSASTSSSVPWSSSTMTNNNNGNDNNALTFASFAEDEDDSSSPSSSSLMMNVNEGLQVYTVGHLMPRNKFVNQDNWSFDANGFSGGCGSTSANASSSREFMYEPASATSETVDPLCEDGNENDEDVEIVPPGTLTTGPPSTPTISSITATPLPSPSSLLPPPPPSLSSSSSQKKLRVRRATFVPGGWAVPPRVLLVDDDAVIRKLSSKFLKIFGCTTDVAVDGIGAVTKMNLEKYDLVLMVNLFLLLATYFGADSFFFVFRIS